MRCGCILTFKERRSQAGTRMAIDKRAVQSWWGTSDVGVFPKGPTFAEYLEKPNTQVCDGNIVVSVDAEEEPYYGGSSAVLSITYKCDTCDNTFYPELPQTAAELSALLTSHVLAVNEVSLRAAKQEAELAERARQDAWREEALADLKVRDETRRLDKARKAAERLARAKPTG